MLAHPGGVAKITPNLLRKEKIHGGISDIFEWIRRDGCARRNEVRAATAELNQARPLLHIDLQIQAWVDL